MGSRRGDRRAYTPLDVAYLANPKWVRVAELLREADATCNAKCNANCHAKCVHIALHDAQIAHLGSILYSAQNKTDGVFPVAAIKALYNIHSEAAITALFDVGMWINLPGGMAEIRDFLEHNTSRAEAAATSEKRRNAAAKRWKEAENDDAKCNANCHANSRDSKSKSESKSNNPSVSPLAADAATGDTEQTPKPRPNRKRGTQLPDDWTPNPRHADIAAERGVTCWAEAEKFRDWARATGRTYRDWDAAFRNWLRRAEPSPLPAPATDLRAAENARRDAERRAEREARERERAALEASRKANPHAAQTALEAVPNLRDRIAANRRQKAK
ncbi:hypothetical protein [Actinobaculum sp. 352]|uniref:hypothetical protein n=1 Tax=Actinobaculum sp. 352 TaxID=2490946 RepID=UPI000F7EA2D1|nr:hypothetical protein [Actinobaculum sp. 352]RTE49354.1 hypothetical protein EKN07_07240 [Actinobaculum sp. 352]